MLVDRHDLNRRRGIIGVDIGLHLPQDVKLTSAVTSPRSNQVPSRGLAFEISWGDGLVERSRGGIHVDNRKITDRLAVGKATRIKQLPRFKRFVK